MSKAPSKSSIASEFLLDKRMKNALKAIHNYEVDEITIKNEENQAILKNHIHIMEAWQNS